MKRLLSFRPAPSLVVAVIASVLAMGGTGYAALTITGKNVKNSSLTGQDVKNKSLTARDFKGSVRGPAGAQGAQGARGTQGPTGAQGAPGPLLESLPSGRTLKGTYAIGDTSDTAAAGASSTFGEISYQLPVGGAVTGTVIPDGGSSTANCPGSDSSPLAAPGQLCVYEGFKQNTDGPPELCSAQGSCGASSSGATGVALQAFSAGVGDFLTTGTWAVTAP